MSSFTWLDYSEHERRKALQVIDLFHEDETRDELGLGVIRDALADLFFPGTSTIQTRVRYFLFVPWIYLRIEEARVRSRNVARKARELQDQLRQALCTGGEETGVIGFRAGINVQRLPSSVYWQGLQKWGILRHRASEDAYHGWLDMYYVQRGAWSDQQDDRLKGEKGEASDAPPVNWDMSLPMPPDDWLKNSTFALQKPEAAYLIDHIQIRFPLSLLAVILRQRATVSDGAAFPWMFPDLSLSDALKTQLRHARSFSEVMHGAALLYNLLLAEQAPGRTYVETYRGALSDWWTEQQADANALAAWDLGAFWRLLMEIGARVSRPTQDFVRQWHELVRAAPGASAIAESRVARTLVVNRERAIKGGRVRIGNTRALENWNGASGSTQIDFRWRRPVTALVRDLLQPLTAEVTRA